MDNLVFGTCVIHIEVPEGMFIQAWIDLIEPCTTWTGPTPFPLHPTPLRRVVTGFPVRLHLLFRFYSQLQTIFILKHTFHTSSWGSDFGSRPRKALLETGFLLCLRPKCPGYMTSPGYNGVNGYPSSVDVTQELQVPTGYVINGQFPVASFVDERIRCLLCFRGAAQFQSCHTTNGCMETMPQRSVQSHGYKNSVCHTNLIYLVGKGFKMLSLLSPGSRCTPEAGERFVQLLRGSLFQLPTAPGL